MQNRAGLPADDKRRYRAHGLLHVSAQLPRRRGVQTAQNITAEAGRNQDGASAQADRGGHQDGGGLNMNLRPYQAEAVEAVYRHLREKDF